MSDSPPEISPQPPEFPSEFPKKRRIAVYKMLSITSLGAALMVAASMEGAEKEGGEWDGDMVEAPTPEHIAERRRARAQTCNISKEEQAERDRPISRQERRQMERLRRKGRVK